MQIGSKLELMCAVGPAERVGLLELIRLLKFRQEVGRAQPAQSTARRRLRNAAAAVDREARQSAAVSWIVLDAKNSDAGQRVQTEWILRGKRIVATPAESN